jgi:hypothetical protein
MALELLVRNENFYEYRSCDGNWSPFPPSATVGYHGMCGTGTPYLESILMKDSFVYDASIDRYRFLTWVNMANYPSWQIVTSIIHPETGEEESRTPLTGFAVLHAWTDAIYNGGLGKLYAGYLVTASGYGIVDVALPDMYATNIANPHLTQVQIPILAGTNFGYAICPERKLITIMTLMSGSRIVVYDYSNSPAEAVYKYEHPMPESFGWGIGYEDDQRCWMIAANTQHGVATDRKTIMKYNFVTNKIELITDLQNIGNPDRIAQIAWDTKRKKLAAVRIKNDGANGIHDNAFEIYAPKPAMFKVTVPVNVKRLTEDTEVPFIANLIGSKGEGGGSREVSISCAPTASLVTVPKQITEESGRVVIPITPPTAAATETLTVSYNETKVTS